MGKSRKLPQAKNESRLAPANSEANKTELESVGVEKPNESQGGRSKKKEETFSFVETCDWIAELSEDVLENPETAIQDGKLRQLLSLARVKENEDGTVDPNQAHVAKLAILSLLAVFRDILPAYRIRLPTPQEMAQKMTKETKQLWEFERTMLQSYQNYLQLLERTWSCHPKHTALSCTSLLVMCQLLQTSFSFNFASNLLTMVVKHMNTKVSLPVAVACCQAVEHVFANDAQGNVSLEAARMVAKMVRKNPNTATPSMLRSFLKLPLRVHADEAEAAKIAMNVKKKKRRRDKELAGIEAEQQESQAVVDKMLLARNQSEILQTVSLTYFHILKNINKNNHHLLPAALEGLAKFAHLINLETIIDLLAVFKDLLQQHQEDRKVLSTEAALHCILTALQALSGPGKELKTDVKEFSSALYVQLSHIRSDRKLVRLALQCIEAILLHRREYSQVRVASFVKQLWTSCLHLTQCDLVVTFLAATLQLVQRYSSTRQLLENEQDVVLSGQYSPDTTDPDLANPFATVGWELALLQMHVHPMIARKAASVASQRTDESISSAAAVVDPKLLLSESDTLVIEHFVRMKKRHPLHGSRMRFIKVKHKRARIADGEEKPSAAIGI